MELPYAPPRKKYIRNIEEGDNDDGKSGNKFRHDHKRAMNDALTYKAKLEKIKVSFDEKPAEIENKDYTGTHKAPEKKEKGHKKEETAGTKNEKKTSKIFSKKSFGMKRNAKNKESFALSEYRKIIMKKRAEKEAKKLAKRGIVRKGYCSRKSYVDEIDLEDLSVLDPEQIERGDLWAKRFPKDQEKDRLLELTPAYTGMLRECWKRADYVIVLSASGDDLYADELKVAFLATLVKVGFDLEVEKGVLPEHNNLLFVKIHAPDMLLDDYKDHFEVTKFFQNQHVHLIGKQGIQPVWRDYFIPVYEREWVKIVRKRYFKPLRLSNRDRSYITYMIVSHQPFGSRDKYYGLYRLIKNKIVIDGFALHDGPYFLTAGQDCCNANARQMLFYSWAGYTNIYLTQPLSLINEYFGSKIALFFAFYQFYLTMLMYLMPVVLFMMIPAWKILKSIFLREPTNMYCKGTKMIVTKLCPTCMDFNACPIRNLTDFCEVHRFVRLTQKVMTLSPWFTIWCLLFFFFWRQKQNFWRWLWEIYPKPRHPIVRIEYDLKYKTAKRHKLTGTWRFRSTTKMIIHRIITPFLAIIALSLSIGETIFSHAYGVQILRNTSFLMKDVIKNSSTLLKYRDYVALGLVLPQLFFVMFILESIYNGLAPMLTRWENHRLYKNYERSLIYRLFANSVVFNFPALAYVYWIKGRFYRHPLDHWNTVLNFTIPFFHFNKSIPLLGHFMYHHCNKTINCIDEMVFTFFTLTILYMVGVTLKALIFRFFPYIFFWSNTDYNRRIDSSYNAPEWEREYRLKPMTNDTIIKWTNHLVVQIAMFVWFGNIAPWMCFILFVWNALLIRTMAKQLICNYRRPVLMNCRGLGTHNKIINFILLSSPVAHAFNNSRMDLFWKHIFLTKNFSLINNSKNAYDKMPKDYHAPACLYPAKYRHYYPLSELTLPWPFHWWNISSNVTQTVTTHNRYIVEVNQMADILKYTHFFLIIIVLLFLYIPSKTAMVAERSFKENEIRRYAEHEEFTIIDDAKGGIET